MNAQVKNTKKAKRTEGTVSIRNMELKVWYAAGYHCKKEDITLATYVQKLIKKNLKL